MARIDNLNTFEHTKSDMSAADPNNAVSLYGSAVYSPRYEFQILRFIRNTHISPYERAAIFNGSNSGASPADSAAARKALVDGTYFTGVKDKNTQSYIALTQQYDVLFVTPDNNDMSSREINMLPGVDGDSNLVGSPGDVAVASHSIVLFKSREDAQTAVAAQNNYAYLAYITVTLRADSYLNISPDNCEEFIAEKYTHLSKLVSGFFNDNKEGESRVFKSLHTGDYFVEVRCNSAETVFRLVATILGSSEIPGFTHTNIAARVDYDAESDSFKPIDFGGKDSNTHFSIRFACTLAFLDRLNSCGVEIKYGNAALFGYYDVTLDMDAEKFACLYPTLCAYRLFKSADTKRGSDYSQRICNGSCGDEEKCSKCCADKLHKELSFGAGTGIKSLSVEMLGDIDRYTTDMKISSTQYFQGWESAERKRREDRIGFVRRKALDLSKRINVLRSRAEVLPKYRTEYLTSVGMLWDMVSMYMYSGAQTELFLNWYTAYEFIASFVHGIELAVDEIECLLNEHRDEYHKSKKITTDILKKCGEISAFLIELIRHGVSGINIFCRLTLAVNQQFFNAANYELHTRLNAQKMIISMSEYMRYVAEIYCGSATETLGGEDNNVNDRKLATIIVPNIGTLVPEAFRLFPHGYIRSSLISGDAEGVANVPIHPILVRLPGFEQFLSIYETIPYLHHELAHHKHIIGNTKPDFEGNRAERNKTIAQMLFSNISSNMLQYLIDNLGYEHAVLSATSSYCKLQNCLAEIFFDEFIKSTPDIQDILFVQLRAALEQFLLKRVIRGTVDSDIYVSRRTAVKNFCNVISRYGGDNFLDRLESFKNGSDSSSYSTMRGLLVSAEKMIEELQTYYPSESGGLPEGLVDRVTTELKKAYYDLCDSLFIEDRTDSSEVFTNFQKRIREELKKRIKVLLKCAAKSGANLKPSENSYQTQDVTHIEFDVLQSLEQILSTDNNGKDITRFWSLPRLEIARIVHNAWETYNEFVSDLFTCHSLKLNVAGYLYFFVSSIIRSIGSELHDVHICRAQMVIAAIRANEPSNERLCPHLLSKVINARCSAESSAVRQILETKLREVGGLLINDLPPQFEPQIIERTESLIEDFFNSCCSFADNGDVVSPLPDLSMLNYPIIETLEMNYNLTNLAEAVSPEKRTQLLEHIERFYQIIEFVRLVCLINQKSALPPKIIKHISNVYKTFPVSESADESRTEKANSAVRSKIAQYINGMPAQVGMFSPRAIAEDAVELVFNMYYQNRVRVAAEFQKEAES